jgi:hypothetical protein
MSKHGKFLKPYQRIYNSMKKIEEQYELIDEMDGEYIQHHNVEFDAYCHLIENIENTIDPAELSPKERAEFDELVMSVCCELNRAPRALYDVQENVAGFIYEAREAAANAVANYMLMHKGRTFFNCGHADIRIPVYSGSSLAVTMKNWQSEGVYEFIDGQLNIDFESIFSKYNINSQSYEVREIAYRAALAVINPKLKLKGKVEAWID